MIKRKRPLAVTRQSAKKLTGHEMNTAAGALLSAAQACLGGNNRTGDGIDDPPAYRGTSYGQVVVVGRTQYVWNGSVWNRIGG